MADINIAIGARPGAHGLLAAAAHGRPMAEAEADGLPPAVGLAAAVPSAAAALAAA